MSISFHPASSCVTRLELWFHDIKLPHATGFIYGNGQDLALVSNWHVFSGKHPGTGISLNPNGLIPNRVKFHVTDMVHVPGGVKLHFIPLDLPLEHDGSALWWQHPGYQDPESGARHVDIGVLPLNDVFEDFLEKRKTIQCFENQMIINANGEQKDWTVQEGFARIGSEVFILGFPTGLASQGIFPIWKRGSIASEPLYHLEGNVPVFLTDALTRHGMSGSPVIYLGSDILVEGGNIVNLSRSQSDKPWLLGVYAGRKGSTTEELEMAVGRVWKKPFLDFVFWKKIPGGTAPQVVVD